MLVSWSRTTAGAISRSPHHPLSPKKYVANFDTQNLKGAVRDHLGRTARRQVTASKAQPSLRRAACAIGLWALNVVHENAHHDTIHRGHQQDAIVRDGVKITVRLRHPDRHVVRHRTQLDRGWQLDPNIGVEGPTGPLAI